MASILKFTNHDQNLEIVDPPRRKNAELEGLTPARREARLRVAVRKMRNQVKAQISVVNKIVGSEVKETRELSPLEGMEFSTYVPIEYEESIVFMWPQVRKGLDKFGIICILDLHGKIMKIRTTEETKSEQHILKARDLLKLLSRGFPGEEALLILRDNYECDFIKIGESVVSKVEFKKRRQRIIGPDGNTLKALELLTRCYIHVHANVVCVVGTGYEGINIVGEVVHDCMDHINPISHIRRLLLIQELLKNEELSDKDWVRFLPPTKKLEETDVLKSGQNPRNIDFLKDHPSEMTIGRQLAVELMKFTWYYPTKYQEKEDNIQTSEINLTQKRLIKSDTESDGTEEPKSTDTESTDSTELNSDRLKHEPLPSLAKAWAFFEHITLPRYVVDLTTKVPSSPIIRLWKMNSVELEPATRGEHQRPTRLYSVFYTPLKQMGDFGIGIGLYFTTVWAVSIMTIVAGFISIPNMMYFDSEAYGPLKHKKSFHIATSALCLEENWVPCPDCVSENFLDKDRFNIVQSMRTGKDLVFALKNQCKRDQILRLGIVNWSAIIFIFFSLCAILVFVEKMEVQFDEDEQTAQDYSLIVNNPPKDAIYPEEWKLFFDRISEGHVTVCTVALDNDVLVKALVERRAILEQIKRQLEPGTSLDEANLSRISASVERDRTSIYNLFATVLHPFGLMRDVAYHYNEIVRLTSKIRGVSQIKYNASKVYVTFETEAAQRNALSILSRGVLDITRNNTNSMLKKHLFRGNRVLSVSEPEEPSTVRWEDLSTKLRVRIRGIVITTLFSLGLIVVTAILVFIIKERRGMDTAAFVISIANAIFPFFARTMTHLEPHPDEGTKQSSLYVKIALFRWVNTAVIIFITSEFTSTLMEGPEHLINAIDKIFVAEVVTDNLIKLSDPVGHFKRHVLGPRAKTQAEMNKNFEGTRWDLAERYTNMTKLMFLSFFYSAIFPSGFILCGVALYINYYTDSWCLMYTWAQAPKLGNSISNLSRKVFFPAAFMALIIMSGFYWAGFPFDDLCKSDGTLPESYFGLYRVQGVVRVDRLILDETIPFYYYCPQDYFRTIKKFPTLPKFQEIGKEWMISDQVLIARIFAGTAITFVILACLWYLNGFVNVIFLLFRSDYEPSGQDMDIAYSSVPNISAYIPQVKHDVLTYPVLACDVDGLDPNLFDWNDPEVPHKFYSLAKDAREILARAGETDNFSVERVFSKIKHWPPRTDDDGSKSDDSSFLGIFT